MRKIAEKKIKKNKINNNLKSKVKKVNSKVKKFKVKQNIPKIMFRCFLLLFFIVMVIGLVYGVYLSFTSSKFNITKVDVKGNSKYTKEEILKTAKVEIGKNINKVNKLKIRSNLKDMIYIDSINIDRKYPAMLVINIKERVAKYAAYDKEKNEYIKLSGEGIMLEKIKTENIGPNETILFGINFQDIIKLGNKVEKTEIEKLNNLEKIVKEYEASSIINKITSIKFENGIYLLTLEYKTDIMINVNDDLEYKMSFLKEIIKNTGILPGVIDMTKDNPYFSQRAS